MEIQNTKTRLKALEKQSDVRKSKLEVSNGRLQSQNVEAAKTPTVEVPSIRLAPEQIEEIHTDEYSLTLFYATRIEPLSIAEIKREFPEPEPKKAQAVIDRFIKVGLVHITEDGKFYSNYPENYINYSHYRYDNDLEARKDAKVFRLMKEFTGNKEYWKDKTYFSMDSFYTPEQSSELQEMFRQIKLKAKEYANDNAKKKTTKGMKFRRMKFYDMMFTLLLAFFVSCVGLMAPDKAQAGGNDPIMRAAFQYHGHQGALDLLKLARLSGGGNDPTGLMATGADTSMFTEASALGGGDTGTPGGGGHDPSENGGHDPDSTQGIDPNACGGGGHDPQDNCSCVLEIEGQNIPVNSPRICRLKALIDFAEQCSQSQHPACMNLDRQIEVLLNLIEKEEGLTD